MGTEYNPRIVTNGLVLYCDAANSRSYSGSGSTTFNLVGTVNGTLTNGVGFGTTNNGYFIFDGVNDYIDFGNSSTVQQNTGSLSVWAKASSPGSGYRGIIAKQYAYGLFYVDGVLVAYDWGAAQGRSTGLNIADGNWKNIVMTYQSGVTNGTIIYLNGSSVLTTSITVSNQALGNLFGGAEANASQFAACNISIFKMYNRVLTSQEVTQNYNATKKRYGL